MKNEKGSASMLIIVILLIVILAGFGYWEWTRNLPQQTSTVSGSVTQLQNSGSTSESSQATSSQPQTIAVAGMSEYTDSSFGFSFWYPSSWSTPVQVSSLQAAFIGFAPAANGRIVKTLQLKTNDSPGSVFIQEQYAPNGILNPAGPGITIKFDPETDQWVDNSNAADPNATGDFHPTKVPITETMGGLPVLWDSFVALSTNTFVMVAGDNGNNPFNAPLTATQPLVQTIIATDPSVGTPESAAQQKTAIETEKQAYAAPPQPYLNASPDSGSAPLVVTFTDDVGGTSIKFGDGQSSSLNGDCTAGNLCTITHTYTALGNHIVEVDGGSVVVQDFVDVN